MMSGAALSDREAETLLINDASFFLVYLSRDMPTKI